MTEAEYFARIDAEPKNTILVFDDIATADRYVAHRARCWRSATTRTTPGARIDVIDRLRRHVHETRNSRHEEADMSAKCA